MVSEHDAANAAKPEFSKSRKSRAAFDAELPGLLKAEIDKKENFRKQRDITRDKLERTQKLIDDADKEAEILREEVGKVQTASMMTRHMLNVRQKENQEVRERVDKKYKETQQLRTKLLQARERLIHLKNDGLVGEKKKDVRQGDDAVHTIAIACEELHHKLQNLRQEIGSPSPPGSPAREKQDPKGSTPHYHKDPSQKQRNASLRGRMDETDRNDRRPPGSSAAGPVKKPPKQASPPSKKRDDKTLAEHNKGRKSLIDREKEHADKLKSDRDA